MLSMAAAGPEMRPASTLQFCVREPHSLVVNPETCCHPKQAVVHMFQNDLGGGTAYMHHLTNV